MNAGLSWSDEPDRVPFLAIDERPRLTWPNGARVALWVCPNLEHYEYLPVQTSARNPWPRIPHPDILGYGVKDYGNRVGFWRMLEVLDRYPITPTASLGLACFEHYPEIHAACLDRGWDYFCHGVYNTQYLWGMTEDDERALIADCAATFQRLVNRPMEGWFSPAASFTENTIDLVAEAGVRWVCDRYHDDQPFPILTKHGPIITLPYAMELNDAVMHSRPHESDDLLAMIKASFDTLWREGETQARTLCLAVHPYITGQPHRVAMLDEALDYILSHDGVWATTGREMAAWYYDTAFKGVMDHLSATKA